MYLILLLFGLLFISDLILNVRGKMEVVFGTSSCGLVDVVSSEKSVEYKKSECKGNEDGGDGENKKAYDSKFY